MDIYKALQTRQTIRDFAENEISKKTIEKLIAKGFPAKGAKRVKQVEIKLSERIHLNEW